MKEYKEVILLKYGEIALKGLNRNKFENLLKQNIIKALADCGKYRLEREQSTQMLYPLENNTERILNKVKKVFGIITINRAYIVDKDIAEIEECIIEKFVPTVSKYKTFKADAKRSDKKFPIGSPEIAKRIGGVLFARCDGVKVDLYNPEVTITVEVRDNGAFIHSEKIRGAGGMPVGSNGRGLILLSGGLDSPVAAYMMARRGMTIDALHFSSEPYTSELALNKVKRLAKALTQYCTPIKFINVSLTKIQEELKTHCDMDYFTLLLRRFMMSIAEQIAFDNKCGCLITGESLGQVASQTLEAINVTNNSINLPVFRPCIGMDKYQIIEISEKIGTFDVSIEPYEDCCTVFTPRHPVTKPKLNFVLNEENKINKEELIKESLGLLKTDIIF